METFRWQSCTFLHGGDVFPISTDALVIAQWVQSQIEKAEHILDAGCGCGVIGILVAKGTGTPLLTGIDIHPQSIEVANRNYTDNLTATRAAAKVSDVMTCDTLDADVIVSNPPYYSENVVPENQDRLRTKHATLTPLEWVSAMNRNLREGGNLYLILPSHSVHVWVAAANESGLYANSRFELYNRSSQTLPVRTMIRLSRKLTSLELTYGSIR